LPRGGDFASFGAGVNNPRALPYATPQVVSSGAPSSEVSEVMAKVSMTVNATPSVHEANRAARPLIARLLWVITFALLTVGATACAEGEGVETCQRTADCQQVGHICISGECQDRSVPRACTDRNQCLTNEECVNGFCGQPDTDTTGGEDVADTSGGGDDVPTTTSDDTSGGDDAADTLTGPDTTADTRDTNDDIRDTIPPTITARDPAPDAVDVALGATINVTFSEPLQPISVTTPGNIYVWNHSTGLALPADTSWDADNMRVTLTPQAPLQPLSPYEVIVTSNVVDLANIGVNAEQWFFTTEAAGPTAKHLEVARAYAPEIHQDVTRTSHDVPVRIDFDGNDLPRNNGANAGTGSGDPAVYYLVSETESHFFIHYALYYPSYRRSTTSTQYAHSVNGVLVVVRKVTGDPLGELQLFQTFSALDGRTDTFLPGCSGGAEPFCSTAVTAKPLATNIHTIPAASYASATDARRVPVYVQPDNHNVCHFAKKDGNSGWCGRSNNDYIGVTRAVLSLHPEGSTPSAPNFTQGEGTYALYPLSDWWLERASVGDNDDAFFLNTASFTAAEDFHVGKGRTIRLPDSLNTPADQRDSTGRTSPFAWNAQGTGKGRWAVDPAFVVQSLLTMPAPYAFFESKYCFNLLAGLDRSADALCQ
jgi:hypothetical protein